MELTFASLMVRANDEPDALYGLAARAVRVSADGSTYRYLLRPEAKFHDGTRLTAHDAAFSLNILKEKGHPIITQLLRDFIGAEAADEATVVLRFKPERARDVPLFAAGLPIFSRAYYGQKPFDETTLDVPLGSGPVQGRPLRARALHRIPAAEGLVGRRPSGVARPLQFRHRALRILPRPRRRVRRLHRPELSVPRGVHLAHLGDALRFPGHQGQAGQARGDRRSHAIRRAGLVPQHAAAEVQGPQAARGADLRVRLRVDQQEHHVRLLRPHAFGVPELRDDGERQAGCRRACAAGAVPRQGAGRGVRRAVRAAGVRRLGRRPRAAAPRRAASQRGRLRHQGRQAHRPERRAHQRRVPDRGADLPAAPHAVHQESQHARHRRHGADRRSGADAEPPQRLRLRSCDPAVRLFGDAGRFAALVLLLPGGRP